MILAVSMVTAVVTLLVQMRGVQGFLHDNAGLVAGLRLEHNSATPKDANSLSDTRRVLESAKAHKIFIPSDVVVSTGTKFMETSQNNAAAWDTTLAFLDYRSYLNPTPPLAGYYSFDAENSKHLETFYLYIVRPHGKSQPRFTTSFARADITQSARFELIDHPMVQTAKQGAASVLGMDGALSLDGMYLRHVVLYEVEVYYKGGPLIL